MRDTAVTSRGSETDSDRLSYPASTPTRKPSEDSNRLSPGGLVSPRLYIQSGALQDIAFHLPAGRRCARAHLRRVEHRAGGSDLAQHGRDRIDQGAAICARMASLQRGWDEIGRR